MYSAWSSLRSPARDSRWRTSWPLEASNGAVPVWAAKWCLLGNRPMSPTSPRNDRRRTSRRAHGQQPRRALGGQVAAGATRDQVHQQPVEPVNGLGATATTSWRRLLNRCSPRGSDPAPCEVGAGRGFAFVSPGQRVRRRKRLVVLMPRDSPDVLWLHKGLRTLYTTWDQLNGFSQWPDSLAGLARRSILAARSPAHPTT